MTLGKFRDFMVAVRVKGRKPNGRRCVLRLGQDPGLVLVIGHAGRILDPQFSTFIRRG